MDKSASPCQDFYQYACGSWIKANPIPPGYARWGRFDELNERNQRILRDILETSSAKTTRSPVEQKIGDYFQSCMDEAGIEAQGTDPLKPYLQQIAGIKDRKDIAEVVGKLQQEGIAAFFALNAAADYNNSRMVIVHAAEGGLTLPDRDYYLKDDARSVELRTKYVAHVQKMFQLSGQTEEKATAAAASVMALETALARPAADIVSRRNPLMRNHPSDVMTFIALAPSFNWIGYARSVGLGRIDRLNVRNPEYFKAFDKIFSDASVDDVKTYLTWHVLHATAATLPKAFVEEDFDFFQRTLSGVKEMKPRWKRCVASVDGDLGEALGQKYVELAFGQDAKQRMATLIANLGKALEKDINTLDWMTDETKKRALGKLKTIQNKVGYPEKWLDYSRLQVKGRDYFGNSLRSNAFHKRRDLDKIGKPPDTKEWSMSPPTVNAYYRPSENNINFPAGILQPPFFDVKLDDAVNYGGIGSVIGHEITHGFDDQGRRFDADGNLKDWWTPADGKSFEERAACIDKQYSDFVATGDLKLNGKLTLGENTADNGGVRIALMALMDSLQGKEAPKIDDYTPEQRFFLGFAQVWCESSTEASSRRRALTDPHSPGRYRTNGTFSNMPEFWKAWGCTEGQSMVRGENACRVW
ncbi:MAG: M13 family metallopeptidase [Bryobacteraceae bacterium]|nr:M13 family metallopeptidase [Bryobacteraceae bacterium]